MFKYSQHITHTTEPHLKESHSCSEWFEKHQKNSFYKIIIRNWKIPESEFHYKITHITALTQNINIVKQQLKFIQEILWLFFKTTILATPTEMYHIFRAPRLKFDGIEWSFNPIQQTVWYPGRRTIEWNYQCRWTGKFWIFIGDVTSPNSRNHKPAGDSLALVILFMFYFHFGHSFNYGQIENRAIWSLTKHCRKFICQIIKECLYYQRPSFVITYR